VGGTFAGVAETSLVKQAALGFRMHSGWGVLVAACGGAESLEVVERRRIEIIDSGVPGGKQPYHHAAQLRSQGCELQDCEQYIAACGALAEGMALAVVVDTWKELIEQRCRITSAAVLMAAGRVLPSLSQVLGSHPLIHTAEGEFFRLAVRRACEQLKIPVEEIRERDLTQRAELAFGKGATRIQRRIASLGKTIGPPWTSDHKAATMAALLALERK
jgi:hypothetical protein